MWVVGAGVLDKQVVLGYILGRPSKLGNLGLNYCWAVYLDFKCLVDLFGFCKSWLFVGPSGYLC